jgi:hypothetical protein
MTHRSFALARISTAISLATVCASPLAGAQTAPPPQRPAPAPTHEWTFDEGTGSHVAEDAVGDVAGAGGADAIWVSGEAAALGAAHDKLVLLWPSVNDDPNAYVDFGAGVGAFGGADFTITHDFVTSESAPGALFDVLGNRTSFGHGNFFSVRMRGDGVLAVELDQDSSGTNYIGFLAAKPVNDSRLHHIAYVRQGAELSLYIDGWLSGSGETTSGAPTYVAGADSFRIGRRAPFAQWSLGAFYDDLRIYDVALTPAEIQAIASGG